MTDRVPPIAVVIIAPYMLGTWVWLKLTPAGAGPKSPLADIPLGKDNHPTKVESSQRHKYGEIHRITAPYSHVAHGRPPMVLWDWKLNH